MDQETVRAASRYFPLLGEARPACPPLPDRIAQIATIAETAAGQGADALHEAAHALNMAALVASDCGLSDLARQLCWQHINVYCAAPTPLTARQARYLLEPVHNLARLQLRAENGQKALDQLHAMYRATKDNTDLLLDGLALPVSNATGTRHERYLLREWAWRQYIADGVRALTLANRWDDAVTHAQAVNGIGDHLMHGRQAAIFACLLHGRQTEGRALLDASTPEYPWEQHVAGWLTVMCAEPRDARRLATELIDRYIGEEPRPDYAVFRTRLGLTAATIANSTVHYAGARLIDLVAREASDGYAAREVLNHPSSARMLTCQQRDMLSGLVAGSGIGARAIPQPLRYSLRSSADAATKALAATLGGPCR